MLPVKHEEPFKSNASFNKNDQNLLERGAAEVEARFFVVLSPWFVNLVARSELQPAIASHIYSSWTSQKVSPHISVDTY